MRFFLCFLLLAGAAQAAAPADHSQEPAKIRLPIRLLEQEEQVSRMFGRRQELEFDLYLTLLKENASKTSEEMEIPLERLAESVGLSQQMNQSVYTRHLWNSLNVLEKQYHLVQIEREKRSDRAGKETVLLRLYEKRGEEIVLPPQYWTFHWPGRFSFPAKWTFLVCLALEKEAGGQNGWDADPEAIQGRFHMPLEIFQKGLMELRRCGLLEPQYYVEPRRPSELQQRWKLGRFYDPREVEEGVKELGKEYGAERVALARNYSHLIYAEYDLAQMEQLVLLLNRFGGHAFRSAMATVGEESYNSPKRSLDYATALMQERGAMRK